jgi:hypothetical protein
MEYQQRKLEEMRRVHEQEQQEREQRLREKERERQDRDKLQASRIPGERATLYDLITVQFSVSTTFEVFSFSFSSSFFSSYVLLTIHILLFPHFHFSSSCIHFFFSYVYVIFLFFII